MGLAPRAKGPCFSPWDMGSPLAPEIPPGFVRHNLEASLRRLRSDMYRSK